MTDTQWRITPPSGIKTANVREEASTGSRVVAALADGTIVHVDSERTPDGDWLPVLFARGWVHRSVVEAIDNAKPPS